MEIKTLVTLLLFVLSLPSFGLTDPEIKAKFLEKFGKNSHEHFQRTIKRIGNRTIEFEALISVEADAKIFKRVAGDYKNWQSWMLKGINVKPNGDLYYAQVKELKADPKIPNLIHGFFMMDMPIIRTEIKRDFKISVSDKDVFKINVESTPSEETALDWASAELRMYPARTGYLWVYISAKCRLRNFLLYEALPERFMQKEAGPRVQVVIDNYHAEEDRLAKK